MTKKEYYILVNRDKVVVSKEIYQAYWKHTNREKYLERLDRQNRLLLFSFLDEDGSFEESLEDKSVDVEKLVETKEAIDNLYEALGELNDEEREIIEALYFREESTRKLAERLGTHKTSIIRKRNSILNKLKDFLENK